MITRRAPTAILCASMLAAGCADAPQGTDLGGLPDGSAADAAPVIRDGPQVRCTLRVSAISGRDPAALRTINPSLDRDEAADGIQLDVAVELLGKPDGTPVTLELTDVEPAPVATSTGGAALFPALTVDAAKTPLLTIRPKAEGCTGRALSYDVQAAPRCAFVWPPHGALLYPKDDQVANNGFFDCDVVLATWDLGSGSVDLLADSVRVAAGAQADAQGLVAFHDVPLPPATSRPVQLVGLLHAGGTTATCQATITMAAGP
jgi:hypothetical protein